MKLQSFFVALAAGALLTACGGGAESHDQAEGENQDTAAAEAPAASETAADAPSGTYTVSIDSSTVTWTGSKAAGEHTGTIGITSGSLTVENGQITGGAFVLDVTAITNTDIENPEYNDQLVGHLQSGDFFDAETHPTITFNVTGSADGNVNGNLTIKGVENEVSIPTTLAWEGDNMSANGTVTIDRTKWDLKYGSANFFVDLVADKVISDEIKLDIALMASK